MDRFNPNSRDNTGDLEISLIVLFISGFEGVVWK